MAVLRGPRAVMGQAVRDFAVGTDGWCVITAVGVEVHGRLEPVIGVSSTLPFTIVGGIAL